MEILTTIIVALIIIYLLTVLVIGLNSQWNDKRWSVFLYIPCVVITITTMTLHFTGIWP